MINAFLYQAYSKLWNSHNGDYFRLLFVSHMTTGIKLKEAVIAESGIYAFD